MLSNQLVSPNEPGGKDGSTPVHEAAQHGQVGIYKFLYVFLNVNMDFYVFYSMGFKLLNEYSFRLFSRDGF